MEDLIQELWENSKDIKNKVSATNHDFFVAGIKAFIAYLDKATDLKDLDNRLQEAKKEFGL
jgi:hypothetical protein